MTFDITLAKSTATQIFIPRQIVSQINQEQTFSNVRSFLSASSKIQVKTQPPIKSEALGRLFKSESGVPVKRVVCPYKEAE